MEYILSSLTFTGITLIGVLGVYLITGLTGLFSLGQAAFMAVGAYVSAVLVKTFDLPFPVAVIVAIAVGLLAGLLVGLPTVKLRRDYISLVTLGFGETIIAVLNNSTNITGGAMGLSGIPQITNFPIVLASVIVCLLIVISYKYSKYGRQCLALRSDELAAKAMGIDVNKLKLTTFLLASAMTSYAGVLYGFFTSYVEPGAYGWQVSAEWTIIVFVGGINSLTGTIVATILLTGLPELLRAASEWRIVVYCVIVLLIINFRPKGIFGEFEFSLKTIKAWLGKGASA
ncbi:branched-chain amino acid ABC transporter permease [Sporomusa sp.]|uniref:branched-chain amino acid ABC transporter permease n=1 Tax=Sporomusa sp. TaxID=2078658 RepID=UPI002C9ED0CF|nr:branched-chain amino acid ABC transporter permease [Sporomusa sp.]HWR41887.1 branched-chain amino acid ABC transporter permease [Sporomusa sp.]